MDFNQEKILNYSLPGCGKSASIASLFLLRKYNPNMKVYYLMTERNAMAGLQWGLKNSAKVFGEEIKLNAGDLYYSIIKDESAASTFTNLANSMKLFASQTESESKKSDGTGGKGKYTFFVNVLLGLASFKGTDFVSGEVKNINLNNFNSNAIVVVDGLTPISNGIWNALKGDRLMYNQGDWNSMQIVLSNFFNGLSLAPYSVIMLAHANIENTNVGTQTNPNIITKYSVRFNAGQALNGTLGGYFNEIIYSYVEGKDVKWATRKLNVIDGVARNMPLDQGLKQNYALYDVFLTKEQKESMKT